MNEKGRIRLSNNPSIPGPMDFNYEILETPGPEPPADSINLADVLIHNSPTDINSWTQTLLIKSLNMDPSSGFSFIFNEPVPESWKWFTGHDDDNYQYTVWPVIKFNGVWQSAGIVQMWQGRESTGAFGKPTWHDDFHANWCYDSRWGDMSLYYPNPGDAFGFFVSAGNARGVAGVSSVKERSNVVSLVLPNGDRGSWTF